MLKVKLVAQLETLDKDIEEGLRASDGSDGGGEG